MNVEVTYHDLDEVGGQDCKVFLDDSKIRKELRNVSDADLTVQLDIRMSVKELQSLRHACTLCTVIQTTFPTFIELQKTIESIGVELDAFNLEQKK